MPFEPEEFSAASPHLLSEDDGTSWRPMYKTACGFTGDVFMEVMMNMIKNPNLNSSWLFRADMLYDSESVEAENSDSLASAIESLSIHQPVAKSMAGFAHARSLVRRLIPRNDKRDDPMEQTCAIHRSSDDSLEKTLILYLPHTKAADDFPYYHPKVRGIAHLHTWDPSSSAGTVSVHFLPFECIDIYEAKLQKIAFHLLQILDKHGRSSLTGGYVKRVHHDLVVPQRRFQDRYSALKNKYARTLIDGWMEQTDPEKHVFEDLGIASFLMELWADIYKDVPFPGFVDIGCGNGLLVYILNKEGYAGWGFDARKRKSWTQYATPSPLSPTESSLAELFLLPEITTRDDSASSIDPSVVHNGQFPKDTFIISNHADELTPWTPILAAASKCPFIAIPCCSHNLAGGKYRAPPPRDKSKGRSTYASLVDWVTRIGEDCGWEVETEMLRIPSTRNTSLVGRKKTTKEEVDVDEIVEKYGGTKGFASNVAKLAAGGPRGH